MPHGEELSGRQGVTVLRTAWLSVSKRWAVSYEDFKRELRDWEIHPVTLDGKAVGAIVVKGPEIHACINEGFGRWFRKEQARVLQSVIDKHGYAQTHATTAAGVEFVQRLGFKQHGNAFRRYKNGT